MAPRVDPVTANPTQPTQTEIVVIGGGIIGVSTAFYLAGKGIPVVLCEKGHIAGEQSSRNWGWCRAMGRDPRELHLAVESLRLWRTMNDTIGAETGFRQTGIVYFCADEASVAKRAEFLPHAERFQLGSRLLTSSEIDALMPGTTRKWAGALLTPTDGVAEPQKAAPAIAAATQRAGGTVLTNCAVRGIETSGGKVSAVVTEKGRIACKSVVLAGGAWSSLFLRSIGLDLPQLKVLASVMRTAPIPGGPEQAAWGPGAAFRKRLDGGYNIAEGGVISDIVPDSFRYFTNFLPALKIQYADLKLRLGARFVEEWKQGRKWALDEVSPFERVRTLDPVPDRKALASAKETLAKVFPAFAGVKIEEDWGGYIDVTPDVLPVMSAVDTLPGFFIATGFSGHGFGAGPAAGHFMAALVTGERPIVDPVPFRFSRFSDGSRPEPMTGL